MSVTMSIIFQVSKYPILIGSLLLLIGFTTDLVLAGFITDLALVG